MMLDTIKEKLSSMLSSLPGERKKFLAIACLAYIGLVALIVSWVAFSSSPAVQEWKDAIPYATVQIEPLNKGSILPDPDFSDSTPAYTSHQVSIIISGLGMATKPTEDALKAMPTEVAFAFSPYADNLQDWINKSLDRGNETLVLLPMESSLYPDRDPGQKSLSPRLSDQENGHYVEWALRRAKGASGVMNFMGSRFLTDKSRMPYVFKILKEGNYTFIEDPVVKHSIAEKTAQKMDVPYMSVDIKIDSNLDEEGIQKQLEELQKIAKEKGYAVAIAEPYPITLRNLQKWFTRLNDQGIKLASFNTLWNDRLRHDRKK